MVFFTYVDDKNLYIYGPRGYFKKNIHELSLKGP